MTFCQNAETIVKVLLLTPENFGFCPPHPFGGFSDICQKFIMYVTVVVFMVPDPNLHVLIPGTLSFTCFVTDPVFQWVQKLLGRFFDPYFR